MDESNVIKKDGYTHLLFSTTEHVFLFRKHSKYYEHLNLKKNTLHAIYN